MTHLLIEPHSHSKVTITLKPSDESLYDVYWRDKESPAYRHQKLDENQQATLENLRPGHHYKFIIKKPSKTCDAYFYMQVRQFLLENGHPLTCLRSLSSDGVDEVVWTDTYHAVYTKEELQQLLHLADKFVERKPSPAKCNIFYRNKKKEYYKNIEENCDNVMEVYIKDNNGDPASPINRVLYGLFFGTKVIGSSGKPCPISYFGEKRYQVPAQLMLNDTPNVYFTDFYCVKEAHYVTLVLTKEGSEADIYCKTHLIPVDLHDNLFLFYKDGTLQVTRALNVELLYTENVDFKVWNKEKGCSFKTVQSRGTSKPDGLPKNKNCIHCNFILDGQIRSAC